MALLAAAVLVLVVVTPHVAAAAPGPPTTYPGPAYSPAAGIPTADKPQSKTWFLGGSWWALMSTPAGPTTVHELLPNHTWRDTGTIVDDRVDGTGDALWSEAHGALYVATRSATANLRIARLTYAPGARSWSMDSGYPVIVASGGGSESATIAQDSTGRLWVTYTRLARVWVTHSDAGGANWQVGFNPTVPDTAILSDDISSIVAFGSSVGLMWSDQGTGGGFRFAIHDDADPPSQWRVEDAYSGEKVADDHIQLRTLPGDPRVFAAIKTARDDLTVPDPAAALVGLLVRSPQADGTGSWSFAGAGTVADRPTRPTLALDATNQELYFFTTAPTGGGNVYVKKAQLAAPTFVAAGRGTPFVDHATAVTDGSTPKAPVTGASGLVVLASAEGEARYVHAEAELAGAPPPGPDTTAPSVPAGLVATPATGEVRLSWSGSLDDTAVTGYVVLRDGTEIATVPSTEFTDTAVTVGATHRYAVLAVDAAGNRSAPSAAVTVTVPAEGGVALRGSSSVANSATPSVVLPTPTTRADDVLLATIDARGRPTITPPTGWTLVRDDTNDSTMRKATFWRVATAGEPASHAFGLSAAVDAVGSILSYSGVSTSAPVQASGGLPTTATAAITAPTVTTTSENAMVVALWGIARAATTTPPVGMTERTDVASRSGAAFPVAAATADAVHAAVGATGPRIATASTAGTGIGQTVALAPAGGGTPPPADTQPPTVPTALTATPGADRVTLTWAAASDDTAVTGYDVRRDGAPLTTLTGTTHTDTDVAPGSSHTYTVAARDAAGNVSAESAPVGATVPATPPPGSGIVHRATTGAAGATPTTLVLETPPTAAGDVLLLTISVRGRPTITGPAEWQLVRSVDSGSTMRQAVYRKAAGSAEPASTTWSFGAPTAAVGTVSSYSGTSATAPVEASAAVSTSGTAVTAPAVTTATPGALVVGVFGLARGVTFTPPAGTAERADLRTPVSATYQVATEVADLIQTSPGVSGPWTATASGSGTGAATIVVLRPTG